MAYAYEFPHTGMFDSDLREIIQLIKKLMERLPDDWDKVLLRPTVINVKDYGAVGDGDTDDTRAINKAISENYGRIIFIPKGVYIITDTIRVPGATTLIGEGIDSTILKLKKSINKPMIANNATYDSSSGWFIRIMDLGLHGNGFDSDGILLYRTNESILQNLRLLEITGENIRLKSKEDGVESSINNRLLNVLIRGSGNGKSRNGVKISSGVTDTIINGTDVGACTIGIDASGSYGNWFTNASAWQCNVGFNLYDCSRLRAESLIADYTNTTGFVLTNCNELQLINCLSKHSNYGEVSQYEAGFSLNNVRNSVLSNCMTSGERHAIGLTYNDDCDNIRITNSLFNGWMDKISGNPKASISFDNNAVNGENSVTIINMDSNADRGLSVEEISNSVIEVNGNVAGTLVIPYIARKWAISNNMSVPLPIKIMNGEPIMLEANTTKILVSNGATIKLI